ncbi:hypothetical protein MBLNU457_g0875t1 [Dothideomycetes sp. NU457]
MAASIDHKNLGKIQGKSSDGVIQYLGIKYGQLKDRFAGATMAEPTGPIDATTIGPAVLSPPDAVDMEQGLIQHTLPFSDRQVSDLEGLNLNITVPSQASSASRLPVLVFVHGGGFFIGCGSWPEYDCSRLVKMATEKSMPVIAVTFNYRLGAPGFLTSEAMRKAGYKPNNGLRDQALAFKWVHKHIAGFGGDPESVTAIGQSAGGASLTYHLHSKTPLFKRAVIMSGTDLLVRPSHPSEDNYNSVLSCLKLESKSPDEQLSSLTTMPAMHLLSIPPSVHFGPVIDSDIVHTAPSFTSISTSEPALPATTWLKSFVIGDCGYDGSILFLALGSRPNIGSSFQESITASLGADTYDRIDKTYLSKHYRDVPDTPDERARAGIQRFGNDIAFYAPTIAYAKHFHTAGVKTYVYRFNATNPWDGPYKFLSNHILDIAFLFQNYNDFLQEATSRQAAVQFAEKMLAVVAGEEPWAPWSEGGDALYVFDSGVHICKDVEVVPENAGSQAFANGRRQPIALLAAKVGWQKLEDAWGAFVGGE